MNFGLWLCLVVIHPIVYSMQNSCESDRCLKKEANVEVSAVLVPCHPHKSHRSCHSGRNDKIQGLDCNALGEGKMKDCVKKVFISVSLTNVQHTNIQSEYVVIDEVFDCQSGIKEKILYPYVLKIRRTPRLLTYGLEYEGSVKEKNRIIELGSYQRKSGKSRCNISNKSKTPWFDFNVYSTNTKKKRKRETTGADEDEVVDDWKENSDETIKRKEKNQYDIDMETENRHQPRFREDKLNNYFDRGKRDPLHNAKKELPFGVEGEKDIYSNMDSRSKDEKCSCFGGGFPQNSPKTPTLEENLDFYHSALDNMKYDIYKLQEPSFTQNLFIEIFEKHVDVNEKIHWNSLTDENPIFLCASNTESCCANKSCVVSYSLRESKPKSCKLPFENMRLLIPEFPHLRGGPEEFLVIPGNVFTPREDFSESQHGTFGKNITKCTSMKHPPIWFRQSDLEKESRGYNGNYFLKYFAKLPETPLVNVTDDPQNLTVYSDGSGQNTVSVEIKADFNIVLKQHASAVITEVYVDATNVEKTEITVKVTNSGLVNAVFYVFLTDCPLRLPADFSNIASSSAVISPQQQHVFSISVLFALPKRRFFCSIDVKNHRGDVVAFRRIRFQRRDRCICMWHCSCTCLETDKGLKCKPLPIDLYNAAGFHGGLPMASKYIHSTNFVQEYVTLFSNLCLATTIVLLVMGLSKAFLGLCFPSIGSFGLRWYLGLPKSIDEYYESNLKKTPEQYDNLQWPIHPDIKQTSRITTMPTEFSINLVFFLFFPLILLHAIVIKLFTPEYINEKLNISKRSSCDCFANEDNETRDSSPVVNQ